MNVINKYIIQSKYNYIKKNNDKINNFNQFFSSNVINKLLLNYDRIKYNKYNMPTYFISTKTTAITNTNEIKFDKKNLMYKIKNNNILKTKLITWSYPINFFILFNYMDMKIDKDDSILLVSANYGIAEMLLFYKYTNFDHYYYKKNEITKNFQRKMKDTYKFNDYEFGTKPNRKYKFMIFNIILKTLYEKNYDDMQLKNVELENIPLLEHCYQYIENLEKGGNILIYIGLCFTEETILLLENITNHFHEIIFYSSGYNILYFPFIYCKQYKGEKLKKETKISKDFHDLIKKIHVEKINGANEDMERYKYIQSLDCDKSKEDCNMLKQLESKNLYISQEVARFIGFKTYLIQDNLNLELSKNLQNLFSLDEPVTFTIEHHDLYPINIVMNKETKILSEIKILNDMFEDVYINGVDLRPAHIYEEVVRNVRLYEQSLKIRLGEIGIKINNRNVSRAWIKFYEILKFIDLKNFHKNSKNIKTFHLCEAPGNFIYCLEYYVKTYMKDTKLDWNSMSLKAGYGDDYGMIKNNPNKWTWGCDGTGDITKKDNIVFYKDKCMDVDWIVGDCGLAYDAESNLDLKLYYAEILFILHNLKKGGNFIIKMISGIIIKNKILLDMLYLLFNSFEKIVFFKPVQNKFSPEFYIIGYNYTNMQSNDLSKLFIPLESDIKNISIIDTNYSDDFKYMVTKGLNLMTSVFIETLEMQLFYTDFWHELGNDIKDTIKVMIDRKNKEFIKKYF